MKLSARNVLQGRIVKVSRGPIHAQVKLDIGGGTVINATITTEAAEHLALAEGDAAYAVVKSSDVMIAKD